ncbi:hypothetical protein [Streptomyces reniochalinae]|uniref:Uncharacterized protein n=1 Tax=Streptomyces reniochalinae TaxID=2250578 RepID=A0A367EUE0_9ACTN|nr:hypothetical protein [Streptomyces reniochalinae]RCG21736.1 hypothetical protein DQ392_08480 [Streptomyces reniochalinae]
MRVLGREPALVLNTVSAALSVLVTLNFGMTTAQAGAIVAVISAVFAAAAAVVTRPIAPNAFTGLVAAVAALTAAFGFEVAPETVGAITGLILAGLALLTRGQVSPSKPDAPAAGA